MKKLVQATGTRKKAVARATLTPGNGVVRINSKRLEQMPEMSKLRMMEPLLLAGEMASKVNIQINVNGGGVMGQTDAVRLAIGKALVEFGGGQKLKQAMLEYDRTLLVADVRQRETRKPNRHGNARAKVTKSYR